MKAMRSPSSNGRPRLAAMPSDLPNKRPHGDRPEGHDDRAVDRVQLGVEPGVAGVDLGGGRPLVDPPLAAPLVLEVLDGVGHVHIGAVDVGGVETLPEHATGRSDERLALDVLAVARLLADEDQPRRRRTAPEHRLRGVAVQRASGAPLRRSLERLSSCAGGTKGAALHSSLTPLGFPVVACG